MLVLDPNCLCPWARDPLPLEVFPSVKQAVWTSLSLRSLPIRKAAPLSRKVVCKLNKSGSLQRLESVGGEHPMPRSRTCRRGQPGPSYEALTQSGATCGSESSAPWWRPGGQAASGRRRPDGCDSGVAPLQGGGRPDWGSVVGRATAQLITSCWESLSPARGDSPGGQAHSPSAGASVSKMNSGESGCYGWGSPPPRASSDPVETGRPRRRPQRGPPSLVRPGRKHPRVPQM